MGGLWWAMSEAHHLQLEMRKILVDRDSPVDVVLVSDIPKEPNLTLGHEHCHTQSMDRRITESLVVKAPSSIQPVKVSFIRFAAEEV